MHAMCMSSSVQFLKEGLDGSPIRVLYANGWLYFDFGEKRDQGPEGPEKPERPEKPEKPERTDRSKRPDRPRNSIK